MSRTSYKTKQEVIDAIKAMREYLFPAPAGMNRTTSKRWRLPSAC